MKTLPVIATVLCVVLYACSTTGCRCCEGCFPWHADCHENDGCPDRGHRLKKRPSITARPASPANLGEPCGIPFYLPKPLLVISKNVYHVEEPTIGLTNSAPIPTSFDHQDAYGRADLNSNAVGSATSPATPAPSGTPPAEAMASIPYQHSGGAPVAPKPGDARSDGLGPHMFFTYEIVFVPDLTQKYVLDVEGGAGEIRAAINLVNGWQFTGLGPYYMKDSSTAQNLFARGVQLNLGLQGAADVINSIANLQTKAAATGTASAAEVAQMAEAIANASTEETFNFEYIDPKNWVDEYLVTESGERIKTGRKVPPAIERYAEVYVYEAELCEGQMMWKPVANHTFSREFLGSVQAKKNAGVGNAAAAALKALGQADLAQANRPQPAVAEAAADSQLLNNIVDKTLTPPPAPCKHSRFNLLNRCRGAIVNRFVNAPLPQPSQ